MIWNWKLPTINFPGEKCIGLRGINPKLHHPSSKGVLHWNFNACVVAEGCLANGHTIILQPQHILLSGLFYLLVGLHGQKSNIQIREEICRQTLFQWPFKLLNEYLSTVYILHLQYAMLKTKAQCAKQQAFETANLAQCSCW